MGVVVTGNLLVITATVVTGSFPRPTMIAFLTSRLVSLKIAGGQNPGAHDEQADHRDGGGGQTLAAQLSLLSGPSREAF